MRDTVPVIRCHDTVIRCRVIRCRSNAFNGSAKSRNTVPEQSVQTFQDGPNTPASNPVRPLTHAAERRDDPVHLDGPSDVHPVQESPVSEGVEE